jgi:hypothetical protein
MGSTAQPAANGLSHALNLVNLVGSFLTLLARYPLLAVLMIGQTFRRRVDVVRPVICAASPDLYSAVIAGSILV